jgi:hypothetical protein
MSFIPLPTKVEEKEEKSFHWLVFKLINLKILRNHCLKIIAA